MYKKIAAIALAAAIVLSAAGCGQKSNVTVAVENVGLITGLGNVGISSQYAGVVVSEQVVEIQKDGDKPILSLEVKEGDEVRQGQILFTYNTEEITLTLEKQKLELEQIKNDITTKQANKKTLEKEKASAPKDQQLEYTLKIQTLEADIKEAQYNQTLKEKEIGQTQQTLTNAQVVSTVAGRVQAISENGTDPMTGMPKPYITILKSGAYRIKGTLNELNRSLISEGQQVIIHSRTDDATWTGAVSTIDLENPESGTNNGMYYGGMSTNEMTTSSKYPFYVTLDSPDGLILGQHVYIEPTFGELSGKEGMWLPSYYIMDADTEPYVWAANDKDRLEKRPLTLGMHDETDDTYEVQEGLTADDFIAFPSEECAEGVGADRFGMGSGSEDPMLPVEGAPENGMGEENFNGETFAEGAAEGVAEGVAEGEITWEEPTASVVVPDGNQSSSAVIGGRVG